MNYWILQSNPRYFCILAWLGDFPWLGDKPLLDCWHISRFYPEVKTDDTVFIWKSKGGSDIRGIYAEGKVEPLPKKFPLENEEASYFIGEKGYAEMERLKKLKPLAVRYTKLCLDKPLLSDAIKKIPEFQDLTILTPGQWRPGIHRVSPGQGRIIESLLCKA